MKKCQRNCSQVFPNSRSRGLARTKRSSRRSRHNFSPMWSGAKRGVRASMLISACLARFAASGEGARFTRPVTGRSSDRGCGSPDSQQNSLHPAVSQIHRNCTSSEGNMPSGHSLKRWRLIVVYWLQPISPAGNCWSHLNGRTK